MGKLKKYLALGTIGLSLLAGTYLGANSNLISQKEDENIHSNNKVEYEQSVNRDLKSGLEEIINDSVNRFKRDKGNFDNQRTNDYFENRVGGLMSNYSNEEFSELTEGINEVYRHVENNGGVQNALPLAAGNYNLIKKYSQEYDFPTDISLGIMILESGGSLEGFSHTGNAGIYQLGGYIAKVYGLEVNNTVDERFSTEKSTEAAHKYLDRLKNERFGRLDLAILGYHQGESNVGNLIADYINKHENPESELSLGDVWKDEIEKYDINLLKLLSDEEISSKYFNDDYALNGSKYVHKVLSAADLFRRYIEDNDSFNAATYDNYRIQSGDTLSKISNTYGTSLDDLKKHNPNIRSDMIHVGQKLYVPKGTEKKDLTNIRNDYHNIINNY
ncbi:MAG: LysM peptidoglycan-binding domain-containing protein [Candidatus Woesearchaeota archaeon]